MRKPVFGVSDTNKAVQRQKMARGLKFRKKYVEGLYYLCRENKDTDQLHGYHVVDLLLCFPIFKKQLLSRCGLYYSIWAVSSEGAERAPPLLFGTLDLHFTLH